MKKIKLVVSDLHVGRGRVLDSGVVNSLEEFYYDEQLNEFLNYYTSGEFTGAEVELIVNGDILNFLQVDYKGHHLTVITESISVALLESIVKGHPKFFAALQKFAQNPNHKITYVIGNHDQCMMWPECQRLFNDAVNTQVTYKNIVYYFDGVHIEHGHMYEAANRIDPRKFFLKKNLPEPILNLPFGSHFFVDLVLKIKEARPYVDKVRPFHAYVKWGLINDTFFTLKTIFLLMHFFIKTAFARNPRHSWSLTRIAQILKESAVFPDLETAAERILEDERVHTVIFGHTHVYMYRQFSPQKEYFNTGTWTELTSLDITSLGKITKLTYVYMEYPEGEQRPRSRLKEWRGYHRVENDVDIS
ncbi:MAG: metallophosphoesterase [Bdellovibrionales bacterium]